MGPVVGGVEVKEENQILLNIFLKCWALILKVKLHEPSASIPRAVNLQSSSQISARLHDILAVLVSNDDLGNHDSPADATEEAVVVAVDLTLLGPELDDLQHFFKVLLLIRRQHSLDGDTL